MIAIHGEGARQLYRYICRLTAWTQVRFRMKLWISECMTGQNRKCCALGVDSSEIENLKLCVADLGHVLSFQCCCWQKVWQISARNGLILRFFEITTSDTLLLKCFISSMRVLWLMLHCPTFCDELIVAMSCHFSAAAGKMFDRFHIEMRLYWGCLRSLHQMDSSWSVSFHPPCGSCEWCCTVQPAVCSCGWAKNFRPTLSIEAVSQYGNTQKGSPACSLHACTYLTMMPASYCCHHKADTSLICYNTKRIIIRTQTSKRR